MSTAYFRKRCIFFPFFDQMWYYFAKCCHDKLKIHLQSSRWQPSCLLSSSPTCKYNNKLLSTLTLQKSVAELSFMVFTFSELVYSQTNPATLHPRKSSLLLRLDPALISHTRFSLIKVFSNIWKWEPGALDYSWKSQQEGRFSTKWGWESFR